MCRFKNILGWLAIVTIIVLICVNIFISVAVNGQKHNEIDHKIIDINSRINSVEESIQSISPEDGYTPVKGIDYQDGADGRDGVDGKDGTNGADGAVGAPGAPGEDGADGVNGLTPELRCNERKNRWEVRYGVDEAWRILNDTAVKCTVE